MNRYDTLKAYFGHTSFRPGQEPVIESLLAGRDVMAVMPTGAGKSACYQIPALMCEGTTLVISPLISLMKDQVENLCQAGISAAYINSSLTAAQYDRVCERMAMGAYKLVYVAPERLDVPAFLALCQSLVIPFVAVDEAHCVSQWGQNFRPGYLHIARFIRALRVRPVVGAFTATATDRVRSDIVRLLELRAPVSVTTGFDRPNLYFGIRHAKPKMKSGVLKQFLREHEGLSGIVYCSTRMGVEEVSADLIAEGFRATAYHAGMSDADRRESQEDFLFDRRTVMVATNAFGMGIDKSNVSFVVHYNMPGSMEAYYQEAGRAGRDGTEADCLLLYTPGDYQTARFLIENSERNPDLDEEAMAIHRTRELERLSHMANYATTSECLRRYILRYFGETLPGEYLPDNAGAADILPDGSPCRCGNCSNCREGLLTADITTESQMILSCIKRTRERLGRSLITQILRGAKSRRVLEAGLNTQTTYGLLAQYNAAYIKHMMNRLIELDAIRVEGEEYPVLTLGPAAADILFHGERVTVSVRPDLDRASRKGRRERESAERFSERREAHRTAGTEKKTARAGESDPALYRALADLRAELAAAQRIPAFYIFTNATLEDMCIRKPATKKEFLEISGVGEAKLARYGEVFLACIADNRREGDGNFIEP